MHYKLICCEVFLREVSQLIAASPHVVTPEFTPIAAHVDSAALRMQIQSIIDKSDSGGYDAILLGFGLCGNATAGLIARSLPLVIARAHDCCTILLGSREAFEREFGDNLSAEWSCAGYFERCQSYLHNTDVGRLLGIDRKYDDMVELYGEESAKYLWETMNPPQQVQKELIFIEHAETAALGMRKRFEEKVCAEGKSVRCIPGDLRLLRKLTSGEWDEEFLVVEPGNQISSAYDRTEILRSEPLPPTEKVNT